MVLALKVPKADAEKVRRKLASKNIIDDKWSIHCDGKYVYIPLKTYIDGAFDMEFKPRQGNITPYEKITKILKNKNINITVPKRWERLGEVLILPEFFIPEKYKEALGEAYAKVLNVKTVVMYHGISGEFRVQHVEKIWGNGTETVHIENGIKFRMDVAKIMFSSGNINERVRIGRVKFKDKIVVDMFAGIGYFALPAALSAKKVYACEKNPNSYIYLLDNIHLNNMKNIIPLLGDNRNVCPINTADVVFMGYFNTFPYLKFAFKSLKEKGKIYYHDLVREGEEDTLRSRIKKIATQMGYLVEFDDERIIKSYAPRVWHRVYEINAEKY